MKRYETHGAEVTTHPTLPCELLPWDSDFFECRIARIYSQELNDEGARQIDEWCRSNQIRCVYFLARPDSSTTIPSAENHGYRLVDVRLTFVGRPPDCAHSGRSGPANATSIRLAEEADLARLQEIAREGHTNTRFANDVHFPRAKVEELYATWIRLDLLGRSQAVLVAVDETNTARGYISCTVNSPGSIGQIGLVAVSSEARGRGLGTGLVLAACNWFVQKNVQEVCVVTQGNNLDAQRLYQSCGFRLSHVKLWYHKWYS